jgi:membrane dipeptidase
MTNPPIDRWRDWRCPRQLDVGWPGTRWPRNEWQLADVVNHIDRIASLQVSHHAAIGRDRMAAYREQSPQDLDTIADLQRLAGILPRYGDDDITAIMNGNWLRLLRRAWNKS